MFCRVLDRFLYSAENHCLCINADVIAQNLALRTPAGRPGLPLKQKLHRTS
jgi:hypothetical protein